MDHVIKFEEDGSEGVIIEPVRDPVTKVKGPNFGKEV